MELAGFTRAYAVTGQTYSRKVDSIIISAVAGIGVTAHKVRDVFAMLSSL